MAMGRVYTLGYAAHGSVEQLAAYMRSPSMILVDIRLAPRSRWFPGWNKNQLQTCWGDRYRHVPALGNVHYKDRQKGIQLADAAAGVAWVVDVLQQGYDVVLLCACVNEATCHRALVAQLVHDHVREERRK
jgi:uncharacterized protein (DUF488 family)